MINKDTLTKIAEEWLKGKEYFLVDVEITPDNRIVIEIDHANGVWIEDCAELSKFIEGQFEEEDLDDYELEVGSAGIGQPFKVAQQYVNHVGKEVEVLEKNGKKHKGTLKSFENNNIIITTKEKIIPEGKKRPVLMDKDIEFNLDEIKYTKYIITFK